MSASPTAVFQLTSVIASCGAPSSVASGVTGGPTLSRHRVNDAPSSRSFGPNQATDRAREETDSAVMSATIEVVATHACEAPPTNKRKERKYRPQPIRLKRGDLVKIVPLE